MLPALAASLVRMNLYGCCEREPKISAALTGTVWSERVSGLVMTRHHGGRKAREILYRGYFAFSEFKLLSKGDFVIHFHFTCFSRTGSGARGAMLE